MFTDLQVLPDHPEISKRGICNPLPIATNRLTKAWLKATRLANSNHAVLNQLYRFAEELRECAEYRNMLVHGFWDYPSPENMHVCKVSIFKLTKDGAAEQRNFVIDVDALDAMSKRAKRLYHGVMFASFGLTSIYQAQKTIN